MFDLRMIITFSRHDVEIKFPFFFLVSFNFWFKNDLIRDEFFYEEIEIFWHFFSLFKKYSHKRERRTRENNHQDDRKRGGRQPR